MGKKIDAVEQARINRAARQYAMNHNVTVYSYLVAGDYDWYDENGEKLNLSNGGQENEWNRRADEIDKQLDDLQKEAEKSSVVYYPQDGRADDGYKGED